MKQNDFTSVNGNPLGHDKDLRLNVHIGEIIKKRVLEAGMSKAEFARRLATSPTNVHKIFKRDSINTAQLYKMGIILNYDFFRHFKKGSKDDQPGSVDASVVTANDGTSKSRFKHFKNLSSRIEVLDKQVNLILTWTEGVKRRSQIKKRTRT